MTTEPLEDPTDDETPDGTQIPTADDLPDEEGDAGVPDPTFDDLDGEEMVGGSDQPYRAATYPVDGDF